MRLLALSATDWLSYEHLDIDFGALNGVAISGPNDHGKSAILDALTYCLYGKLGRRTSTTSPDQFIREGTDGFALTVEFSTSDGRLVRVVHEKERGVAAKVALYVDGTVQTAAERTSETLARIETLIGLSYDALRATVVMVQHDSAAFMAADPRHRKDLLIDLLGLDQYEPLHRAAKERADAAKATVATATATIARLAPVVAGRDAAVADRDAAQQALVDAREAADDVSVEIVTLREAYGSAKARRDLIAEDVERATRDAEERDALPERIEALREELAAAESEAAEPEPILQLPEPPSRDEEQRVAQQIATITAEVGAANALDRNLQMQQQRLTDMTSRRAVVGEVPCGARGIYATCPLLRAIPSDDDLIATQSDLDEAAAAIAAVQGKRATLADLQYEASLLAAKREHRARAERGATIVNERWKSRTTSAARLVTAHRAALSAAVRRLQALAAEPDVEAATDILAEADATLADLTRQGTELRARQEEAQRLRNMAETEWQQATTRLAAADAAHVEYTDAKATVDVARDALTIWDALARAWHRDGLPTQIIERAIPMIEDRANQTLGQLPEAMALTLRTQRPKKGGMAETLDIVVSLDGYERDYGLISWGARLRVDVALRLALADILTRRSGQRIEWLWFDEPLADLDAENVEAMLEVLAALRREFPLVVVVSHNPVVLDALDAQIRVLKEAAISRAVVAA